MRDGSSLYTQLSIFTPPIYQNNAWYGLIPVFQYAVDEQFRAEQNKPENFNLPTFEPQAPSAGAQANCDNSVYVKT